MRKKALFSGLLLSLNALANPHETAVDAYFENIRSTPKKLAAFLKAMPKGADLHNHLSGAVYAENLILYAKNDNFCLDKKTFFASENPDCLSENLLNNAVKEPSFYNKLIDAWSTRNFHPGEESAPDHFFSIFGKYNAIVKKHQDQMLARVLQQAASDNESYLELMITGDGNQAGKLGKELGWNDDFSLMRKQLLAHPNFVSIIQSASNMLDAMEAGKNKMLDCKANIKQRACNMKVRYLHQVAREQAPEMAFAQMLAGFEIARRDHRFVGLNLVQPEHGIMSMRDYSLQMRMMHFFEGLYPEIPFSLHAGELNEAIASREGLSFHIDEAIHVAHAKRIGHGVDIFYETRLASILKTMADNEIPIEINLSSNAFILDAKGANHPLPLYLNAGVPVTLSTDDQGINRSNLSKEYEMAANSFALSYSTLKNIARNSLSYSFLPGKKLWLDNQYQQINTACADIEANNHHLTTTCAAFLQANEKAGMQWVLEKQFEQFEQPF